MLLDDQQREKFYNTLHETILNDIMSKLTKTMIILIIILILLIYRVMKSIDCL